MKQNQKNSRDRVEPGTEYSFIGLAIDSPSRIDSEILVYSFSNMALPDVSRVMFSASRIGTPLATSVPSVRVVRATIFFSIKLPKIGILMMNRSQPMRPCLNLRISLTVSQIVIGMPGIKYQ